jgi:hypothetical protein
VEGKVQGNRTPSGFIFNFVTLYAGSARFTTNDQSQKAIGKYHGRTTMKTICLSLAIFAFLLISPACKSGANLPARKPPVTVYVETAKKPGLTLRQHGTAGTSVGTPPQARC